MQFLAALTDEQVAYIIMAVIGVIFLVGAIVIFVREWQMKKNIKVKNGVRYTVSTKSEDKQGNVLVSYQPSDKILAQQTAYTVKKSKGKYAIRPGTYTVLSTDDTVKNFNLRIDGALKSLEHGAQIVLVEGQIVESTTINVILR